MKEKVEELEARVDLLEKFVFETKDIDWLAHALETICYEGENILEEDFVKDMKGMRDELGAIGYGEKESIEEYFSTRSPENLDRLAMTRAQIYSQMILKYSERIRKILAPVEGPPEGRFVEYDVDLFKNADRKIEIRGTFVGLLRSFDQFVAEFETLVRAYPSTELLGVKRSLPAYSGSTR